MQRFKSGDRVCFIGDSITHANTFIMHIVNTYKKNFKEESMNFFNCGISGCSLPDHLKLFDEEIMCYNPTHAVIMIGVNDSKRGVLSRERNTERYEILKEAFETYKNNLKTLCDMLTEKGVKITLCTCTPYDEYSISPEPALRGGMALIGAYNEFIKNFARERAFELCDYHSYLLEKLQSEKIINEDRVHPLPKGHFYMAQCFLAEQGMELSEEKFSEKLLEWNKYVTILRGTYAARMFIVRDYNAPYKDGKVKVEAYLNGTENRFDFLDDYAKQYMEYFENMDYVNKRIVDIMEKELTQ